MQSVNDDMDELFRRAAENYPLDTNSADWNKVLAALQGETEAKTISEKKGNNNGRLLWLLLLLPLGLICNQLYSPGILNNEEISKASAGKENLPPVTKNVQQQNTVSNANAIDKTKTVDATKIGRKSLNNKIEKSFQSSTQFYKTPYFSNPARLKTNDKIYDDNNVVSTGRAKTQDYSNNDFMSKETSFDRKYVSQIAFSKHLSEPPPTVVNRNFDPLVTPIEENSKQPIRVQRRKKFYVGIMGGVDATTVKFQKVDNAGATYGVLAGYQINKKWSIETGAYGEKKYYYTEGKYFNTSKANLPASWNIEDVSGNCNMIEVPISLKYNFLSHKNSGWFATIGTSSYFMLKESYSYKYYYGTSGPYLRLKDTTNSTNNIFSTLGFSVGYTHRLGNFADLRIEPYLRVPTSGMGIGSLPLFSTGLQVGLIRKF